MNTEIKPTEASHRHSARSLAGSVLANRCPRCREGRLFTNANPYDLRTTMRMPDHCPVCGQVYELQTGFFFGTGYVSYGISVLLLIAGFVAWYFTIGLSTRLDDDRILWCIGVNTLLLFGLQPLLQRLARAVWIALFVPYDKDRRQHPHRLAA